MNAGKLNRRIQILSVKKEQDKDGYYARRETLVHGCWAKVTILVGSEMVKQNADYGELKGKFLIRWTKTPIDRKMFVRYDGKDFEIQYINKDDAPGRYLTIWAVWRSQAAKGMQNDGGGGGTA